MANSTFIDIDFATENRKKKYVLAIIHGENCKKKMEEKDDEESWMSRTRFPIYRVTNVGVIVAIIPFDDDNRYNKQSATHATVPTRGLMSSRKKILLHYIFYFDTVKNR